MRFLFIANAGATIQILWYFASMKELVDRAFDVDAALDYAKTYKYHGIFFCPDMKNGLLSGKSAIEVLHKIRDFVPNTPILAVESKNMAFTKRDALLAGATAVCDSPLPLDVHLQLHNLALLMKQRPVWAIKIGDITVDTVGKSVKVGAISVPFTPKEYQIFEVLALRRGICLSKQALMDNLYNGTDDPAEKIVDVFICKIRKKLHDAGAPDIIKTRWGTGYIIEQETAPMVEQSQSLQAEKATA
jgi:two-component system cell cycle response regulator CtrA